MKYFVLALVLIWGSYNHTDAQQVANYSTGTPGHDTYEEFSFWARNNQRSTIDYTYGANRKSLRLTYLGKGKLPHSFQVKFPNQLVLTLIPNGNTLLVKDSKGTYNKVFTWKYEGPVDGIGTFCTSCAKDEAAAIKIINRYYIQK
ncbi:hypothetical protein [Siphonobacter sp. SORGH_AS_0500]|uniref:hypothetical protein n=1 Tax=Siphonobacter sp. SORGH_AS_0500 TaxID=1864824 RepID=UPI00286439E0|nr:hypothetical protein [Siphonobacter sp. SORGH_AS_0500]MDR6195288.1 hypothetical protein [Siphonobacter sp. SORGH_AS_0500]